MVRLVLPLLVLHFGLLIAALSACLGGDRPPRNLTRGLWALIIVLVPIAGGLSWYLFGKQNALLAPPNEPPRTAKKRRRGTRQAPPPAAERRTLAPDDDPEFLRDLRRRLNDEEQDRGPG